MNLFFGVLGILCMIYGVVIALIRSGSHFFIIWLSLGGLLLFLSAGYSRHWFSVFPSWIRYGLTGCVSVILLMFVIVGGIILTQFHATAPKGMGYLIVLGAQVKDGKPSVVLQYRLKTALCYLKENPDTICIVSGGQGANESISEAQCMAEYLTEHGIDSERILQENQSGNTSENIKFSSHLISEENEKVSVGIVTNNFHMYRARFLARHQMKDCTIYGHAASSTPLYLPNNLFREILGLMKDFCVTMREDKSSQ